MEDVVQEVQQLPVQVLGLEDLEQILADSRAWLLRVQTTLEHIRYYDYSTSITLLTELLAAKSNLWVQCKSSVTGFGIDSHKSSSSVST